MIAEGERYAPESCGGPHVPRPRGAVKLPYATDARAMMRFIASSSQSSVPKAPLH